ICGVDMSVFSGGQKQRIVIARAFLRRPKLLILDEATSALDTHNESMVLRSIDAIIEELHCTTVIIAHRLSTVRAADKIFVLQRTSDQGSQIVETGDHDGLMARCGV